MKNKGNIIHIYHYDCEIWRSGRAVHTVDGIARMVNKIQTMSDYRDLKALITEDMNEVNAGDHIRITSLSLIGEDDD